MYQGKSINHKNFYLNHALIKNFIPGSLFILEIPKAQSILQGEMTKGERNNNSIPSYTQELGNLLCNK